MSKDRKLIFCFKLDPYFKLDSAGKVKIHSGGCSPEHLWYPLYILPFPQVQDCLPVPVPYLRQNKNDDSHLVRQGVRKPVLAKGKKGQDLGLSPALSPSISVKCLSSQGTDGAIKTQERASCMPNCRFCITSLFKFIIVF